MTRRLYTGMYTNKLTHIGGALLERGVIPREVFTDYMENLILVSNSPCSPEIAPVETECQLPRTGNVTVRSLW
jgi:hypothetical protein